MLSLYAAHEQLDLAPSLFFEGRGFFINALK